MKKLLLPITLLFIIFVLAITAIFILNRGRFYPADNSAQPAAASSTAAKPTAIDTPPINESRTPLASADWARLAALDYQIDQPCPVSMFAKRDDQPAGGREYLNGCVYDRGDYQKLQAEPWSNPADCAPTLEQERNRNYYNLYNGCLYKGEQKIFDQTILSLIRAGAFNQPAAADWSAGELANEWFRFEKDNKLHIYFSGRANCDGCIFNGPYLIIDLPTGQIQLQSAPLPMLNDLILSPERTRAIEVKYHWPEHANAEEIEAMALILWDMAKAEPVKMITQLPRELSIIAAGPQPSIIENSIQWLGEESFRLTTFKADQTGYAANAVDNAGNIIPDQFITAGDQIIYIIDQAKPNE